MSEHAANQNNTNEQHALLTAIWSEQPVSNNAREFEEQGINIYRRNLLANAERALSISFPTVFELLGSDVSTDLTKQFLHYSSPNQGDWAQWGADFATFIKGTEIGLDYPYLADCASLDWAFHRALHGQDQCLSHASLQLLASCEPEYLVIIFNKNVQLLPTSYPLVDIFDAHHAADESLRKVALSSAQQALVSEPVDHSVMIYRPQFQPKIRRLSDAETRFMQALMSGQSLSQALDVVSWDKHFSFEQWLLSAIEHNLIHYLQETQP